MNYQGQEFDEAGLFNYFVTRMRDYGIPSHDTGLAHYIMHGRPMGHFLTAIVENNLRGAVDRADEENSKAIVQLVRFMYNYAPAGCWGNPENVKTWRDHKGLVGLYAQA